MTTDPSVKPPRKKSPGRFHHGDLAEQAAVEAAHLVEAEGHDALSMRRVAVALGVTEPALYRHYEGREDLLAAVASRGFVSFAEDLYAAVAVATGPLDGIRRFCRAYVRAAAARRGWFLLTFSREMSESLLAKRRHAAAFGRFADAREIALHHLARALPAGDDRAADLYRLVWATAHGLALLVVERVFQLVQTDEERLAAADAAIDLFVEGLAARAGTVGAS